MAVPPDVRRSRVDAIGTADPAGATDDADDLFGGVTVVAETELSVNTSIPTHDDVWVQHSSPPNDDPTPSGSPVDTGPEPVELPVDTGPVPVGAPGDAEIRVDILLPAATGMWVDIRGPVDIEVSGLIPTQREPATDLIEVRPAADLPPMGPGDFAAGFVPSPRTPDEGDADGQSPDEDPVSTLGLDVGAPHGLPYRHPGYPDLSDQDEASDRYGTSTDPLEADYDDSADDDLSGSDLGDEPIESLGGRHRQPRRAQRRSRGSVIAVVLAIAAALAIGVTALLWRGDVRQAFGGATGDADAPGAALPSTRERQSVTGTIQPIQDLTVGSCFQDLPEGPGPYSGVEVVDCATSHDNQLVAIFELADREWPGDLVIADEAQARCRDIGGNVVERAGAERAGWDFWVLVPTRQGWVLNDDRVVQCIAYDPTGPVEGDVLS